jgi:hypothetical protein
LILEGREDAPLWGFSSFSFSSAMAIDSLRRGPRRLGDREKVGEREEGKGRRSVCEREKRENRNEGRKRSGRERVRETKGRRGEGETKKGMYVCMSSNSHLIPRFLRSLSEHERRVL